MTSRAPKQWCLSTVETVNSFENWKQNLLYSLSLDGAFQPHLQPGASWGKKTRSSPHRGFTNDGDAIPERNRRTAIQKVAVLELLLGQIANFCPVIARNSIVKSSTSLEQIWQSIRLHYGFQSTGAHFLDLCEVKLEPGERPEDLFQRLNAFVEDNLLTKNGTIYHHSEKVEEDEEMCPTLENFVVLTWLRLVHTGLPRLVKQRYGTELRTRTLASIKPEISLALTSLLDELQSSEDAQIMRTNFNKKQSRSVVKSRTDHYQRSCPLCKQAGRQDNHFLSKCNFLPDRDRQFLIKARTIDGIVGEDSEKDSEDESIPSVSGTTSRRVQVNQSPYLNVFFGHNAVKVVLDSGATANMIKHSVARSIGARVNNTKQCANQADGQSPLHVMGETQLTFRRGDLNFQFDGLVVEQLDVDFLGGVPFMVNNDIQIRPAKNTIILSDGTNVAYGKGRKVSNHSVRLTKSHLLRAPRTSTVWPGECLDLPISESLEDSDEFVLEPYLKDEECDWPKPMIVKSVSGNLSVPNFGHAPVTVKRGQHIARVSLVRPNEPCNTTVLPTARFKHNGSQNQAYKSINLDPDSLMTPPMREKFEQLHKSASSVFEPSFRGYNGFSGPIEAVVNMGPVEPPQRKGRVPQYSRDKLVELQEKFDELETLGVFNRPEDIGISVEYLNPSFLVKKGNGGFRLVTAFTDVGRYSKPQPSLMPDVDGTLRCISMWKFIVSTDLTSAFYQIPVERASLKYCGVVTPFKGVRVYSRCAMGMPGSETALEELMCRVLGDLLMEGIVAKLADDLYVGGNTIDELLVNWKRTLTSLENNKLALSAKKTTICPKTLPILGWIWSQGTLSASPHKVSALSVCALPKTVKDLRSYIGAYKILSRVIPQCAHFLAPLDGLATDVQSNTRISWDEDSKSAFYGSQKALNNRKIITLPQPNDQLWIVTDGASKGTGVGATLYVEREGKQKLAGFFSAKVRNPQSKWLPCEIEALSIASAIKHFSPFIIQSKKHPRILTDSKPCVQAHEKLCRGEYSASPRVATFLATASRYQVKISHLAGSVNLVSDFSSRNAPDCSDESCQICHFITTIDESVVRTLSAHDFHLGNVKLPFTNRKAWITNQLECSDLRRAKAHLSQGTRPSKKETKIKDVKRYLGCTSIASDGLIVVNQTYSLFDNRECIVVPRSLLSGLLTAIHIKLKHPTIHQMKKVVKRFFFALDIDRAIAEVCKHCHQCTSVQPAKKIVESQSTGPISNSFGLSFAADVIKRNKQLILVLRECTTSYTKTLIISDEKKDTLRDGLITLCSDLRLLDGTVAKVRTDPAPGFLALREDTLLLHHSLQLEIGDSKNPNKNPVAEKAIRELQDEFLRQSPGGGSLTPSRLAIATSALNARVRHSGLSARELLTQRDQFTGQQMPVNDEKNIAQQHGNRIGNHKHSMQSKYPSSRSVRKQSIFKGDIIYLNNDLTKLKEREPYIVTEVGDDECIAKKFTNTQIRSKPYRIKTTNCIKIPSGIKPAAVESESEYDEELDTDQTQTSPSTTEPLTAPAPEILVGKSPEQQIPRRSKRDRRPPEFLTYDRF